MITDIYLKKPEEPGYNELSMIEEQEFEILLSQIRMTLLTPTKTVLGIPDFGVDEDRFLFDFSTNFDATTLEQGIRFQLGQYCTLLRNREYSIKVHTVPDSLNSTREVVHVLITVDKKATFVIAYA